MAKVEDCPGFETFGADVKAARKAKHLTRKDLAEKENIESRYLANIKNEGTILSLPVVIPTARLPAGYSKLPAIQLWEGMIFLSLTVSVERSKTTSSQNIFQIFFMFSKPRRIAAVMACSGTPSATANGVGTTLFLAGINHGRFEKENEHGNTSKAPPCP